MGMSRWIPSTHGHE
jgi:hypothetical protein